MSSLVIGSDAPRRSSTEMVWCDDHWLGRFNALGCDCHLLMATPDKDLAGRLLHGARQWVDRFEARYSRYRDDSLCHKVQQARGKSIVIDNMTFKLLTLANNCYRLSEGRFDPTAGVLRKAWQFNSRSTVPDESILRPLLSRIGWDKIHFDQHKLVVPEGMELDFGGIGKEFAVDSVALQLRQVAPGTPCLVNFGGDLALSIARPQGWHIGLPGGESVLLAQGALATSGDTQRYLEYQGKRYGHILDPRTGWPVPGAPSQVTVAGPNCTFAGMLSTLAMLEGPGAEEFLKQQDQNYWLWP